MFYSSAPARVCLFGEHQDYLELKVIPAAIDLRLVIQSKFGDSKVIKVFSQEMKEGFSVRTNIKQVEARKGTLTSYLEAGILALKKYEEKIDIPFIDLKIGSRIPIASGLSSSAALLVAWINHLSGIIELELDRQTIAELAYDAEHNILEIPCGRMDQYASSFGNVFSLKCTEKPELTKLKSPDVGLIVVDSQITKLTSEVHSKKVAQIKHIVGKFERNYNIKLEDISSELLLKVKTEIKQSDFKTLEGVIAIKENTEIAEEELSKSNPDVEQLGHLLTSQQKFLRENIQVSLPILDKIVQTGLENGALGGKLTGAGLGGSVILLSDQDNLEIVEKVKEALKLPTYSVQVDKGTFFEKN